jgi:hypothetical protein
MSYRRGKKDYPKEPNDAYMIEWNGIMVVNPSFQPHMESHCSPEECARRYARKDEFDKEVAAWREEFAAKPAEEQAAIREKYDAAIAGPRYAIGGSREHEIHGPPVSRGIMDIHGTDCVCPRCETCRQHHIEAR